MVDGCSMALHQIPSHEPEDELGGVGIGAFKQTLRLQKKVKSLLTYLPYDSAG